MVLAARISSSRTHLIVVPSLLTLMVLPVEISVSVCLLLPPKYSRPRPLTHQLSLLSAEEVELMRLLSPTPMAKYLVPALTICTLNSV